jgi:predicted permease
VLPASFSLRQEVMPTLGRAADAEIVLPLPLGPQAATTRNPGRLFSEQDVSTTPRVVIVDEHMAEQLWPNEDAVGKRIRTGGIDANANAPWITVVGVVGRIKQDTLDSDSRMAMYLAHTQYGTRAMNVVARSRVDPASLAAAARKEIRDLDADLPVYNVRTMTERVDESLARRRFSMLLLTIFAAPASGIAAIGIYGVVAYFVSQGTREIGIRMALGATPGGVRALGVRQALVIVSTGVGIGLGGALAVARLMRSLLFGIGATDPVTFVSIPILLALVALIASYVPARRAARIDPMVALRHE